MPDPDQMEMNPMAMFSNAMSFKEMFAGLTLPADGFVRASARARKSAKDDEQDSEGTARHGLLFPGWDA